MRETGLRILPRRAARTLNQVSQGEAMITPSSAASFMHSRFCAAAVRNMALLFTLPWNCDMTRNVPSFLDDASPVRGTDKHSDGDLSHVNMALLSALMLTALLIEVVIHDSSMAGPYTLILKPIAVWLEASMAPGLLPEASERLLMMGMNMPPARAVVLGIAGATSASATLRPYARPSVDFPNARTNSVATRSPRPVCSKPCAQLHSAPWARRSQHLATAVLNRVAWPQWFAVSSDGTAILPLTLRSMRAHHAPNCPAVQVRRLAPEAGM